MPPESVLPGAPQCSSIKGPLWSLLDGTWGLLNGSWGVLVCKIMASFILFLVVLGYYVAYFWGPGGIKGNGLGTSSREFKNTVGI